MRGYLPIGKDLTLGNGFSKGSRRWHGRSRTAMKWTSLLWREESKAGQRSSFISIHAPLKREGL